MVGLKEVPSGAEPQPLCQCVVGFHGAAPRGTEPSVKLQAPIEPPNSYSHLTFLCPHVSHHYQKLDEGPPEDTDVAVR